MEQKKGGKIYYGVWIVAAYCLIVPAIYMFSNPIGLYMLPICDELGISQGVYSLSRTCVSVICAFSYLLYVPLQKRCSLRVMICLGLLCGAMSAFCYSAATSVAFIFIAAFFNALINPLSNQISMGNLMNNWFVKHNATIMSIIFACGNIGGFFNAKLIAHWISTEGWRGSMRITMLILLSVMVVVFLIIRDHPSQKGLRPYGAEENAKAAPAELPGAVYKDTLKTVDFWGVMLWACLSGIIVYPVINIVPAYLSELGFDTVFSGTAVSFISIGTLVTLPLVGISVDRWGIRPTIYLSTVSYVLAVVLLLFLAPGNKAMALAATTILGISSVSFPALPMFIKVRFGFRDYSLYSTRANIVRMLGNALGYPLLGFAYDIFGSYRSVFILFILFSLAMLAAGLTASRKNHRLWTETRPGYPGYTAENGA